MNTIPPRYRIRLHRGVWGIFDTNTGYMYGYWDDRKKAHDILARVNVLAAQAEECIRNYLHGQEE